MSCILFYFGLSSIPWFPLQCVMHYPDCRHISAGSYSFDIQLLLRHLYSSNFLYQLMLWYTVKSLHKINEMYVRFHTMFTVLLNYLCRYMRHWCSFPKSIYMSPILAPIRVSNLSLITDINISYTVIEGINLHGSITTRHWTFFLKLELTVQYSSPSAYPFSNFWLLIWIF